MDAGVETRCRNDWRYGRLEPDFPYSEPNYFGTDSCSFQKYIQNSFPCSRKGTARSADRNSSILLRSFDSDRLSGLPEMLPYTGLAFTRFISITKEMCYPYRQFRRFSAAFFSKRLQTRTFPEISSSIFHRKRSSNSERKQKAMAAGRLGPHNDLEYPQKKSFSRVIPSTDVIQIRQLDCFLVIWAEQMQPKTAKYLERKSTRKLTVQVGVIDLST